MGPGGGPRALFLWLCALSAPQALKISLLGGFPLPALTRPFRAALCLPFWTYAFFTCNVDIVGTTAAPFWVADRGIVAQPGQQPEIQMCATFLHTLVLVRILDSRSHWPLIFSLVLNLVHFTAIKYFDTYYNRKRTLAPHIPAKFLSRKMLKTSAENVCCSL